MIIQANDLGVEIDLGLHPDGSTLQRLGKDGWTDYLIEGEPVTWPVGLKSLPPGQYRLID